jgi:hypothetical protein
MQKVQQKVRWTDLFNATQHELKSTYKLSDRELEKQVRSHLDGASSEECRSVYEKVYNKRR